MKTIADTIRDWTVFVAAVGTLSAIITLVITQKAMTDRHDETIKTWRDLGTPAVVSLKATYDEHFRASDSRIDKLESALNTLSDIKVALGELKIGQKELKESLEEHKKQKP